MRILIAFIVAFTVSVLIAFKLFRYSHLHEHISSDYDVYGVQKFHDKPVLRIGGVSIFMGVLIGLIYLYQAESGLSVVNLLLCTLPVFVTGFVEDLTKRVSISVRLLSAFISTWLGIWLLDAVLKNFDLPLLDSWLKHNGIAGYSVYVLLTLFMVSGVTHSMNIIDGYNGLCGMVAILILFAIGWVSYSVGDMALLSVSAVLTGAILGFLVWNWPFGKMFAGDGGAYLIGFVIAELSVLLVVRNPQVSPWFPLLLLIYPVFETIFSIYRRVFLHKKLSVQPDAMHLHHLVYRRLLNWMCNGQSSLIRNSRTSPFLWGLSLFSIVPALLFWEYTVVLKVFVALFVLTYVILYWQIVRFKTPHWLKWLARQ